MTERDGPPEPLDVGLEDLLVEFRDGDVLPEDARERIWKTVSADEPPRRRFVPPPVASAHPGRRWAIGAVVAVAAVTVLWLGLGDRLTADEAEQDPRRDAAAMVEHGDASPSTAVERERASTKPRARAPEPESVEPPSAPLEPNAPVESDAGVPQPETVEPPKPGKSRPRPKQAEPDEPDEPDEPAPSPASTLAEEQRLVGKAWSALTEGNPEGAMTVVRTHAEQFPSGMLAPERDAVSAIARCRISPDASASILAAFRRAHASSPLASRVSKACTGGEKKSPAP